jgi:2-polyprenyl-6-methoxyphenol hydroxylase-like FAD-dependent oxidoreductase
VPLPGDVVRIVAPVPGAPEVPSAQLIRQLPAARGLGVGRLVVTDLVLASRFRIHNRVADTYRSGRLLLGGMHPTVQSPAGGQGMNLGIQDGVALADTRAIVPADRADSALGHYTESRRPMACDVVAMTERLTH